MHVRHSAAEILETVSGESLPLTYLPTPKLRFQEQISPKSGTQHNFLKHISKRIPTLMKKSGNKILWENRRAIYIVHLPYQFRAAENAVC